MDANPPPEHLMTASQVGEWLSYSADSIHRLTRTAGLPFRKMLGGRKRFLRAEVQAWLDRRAVTYAPEAEMRPAPPPNRVAFARAAPRPPAAALTEAEMLARLRAAARGAPVSLSRRG